MAICYRVATKRCEVKFIFFYHSYHYTEISKKKKKIIPRCTKATITSLGRSDVGEAYVKNACVNTVDKRSKTTMIEKNKRPPSEK